MPFHKLSTVLDARDTNASDPILNPKVLWSRQMDRPGKMVQLGLTEVWIKINKSIEQGFPWQCLRAWCSTIVAWLWCCPSLSFDFSIYEMEG